MSDSASLEDDFSIIQVEDTYHTSESMLTKSQYAKVIFHDIAEAYPTDSDICCRYTLTDGVTMSPGDCIELFRVGWSQVKESLIHHSVPECAEPGQCDFQVLFNAAELPKDLCDFYQLCYVTVDGGVCGASVPFQFRVPEATELCAVEEADDLLIFRSRESITDHKLRQADESLMSLRLEMTRKDLELERLLACLEASNTEKKLLEKKVAESVLMEQKVQQLEADMDTLVKDRIEAKDKEHKSSDMRTFSEETNHLRGQVESLQLMLEALSQSKDLMAQELQIRENTITQMIKQRNAENADGISVKAKLEDSEKEIVSLKHEIIDMKKNIARANNFQLPREEVQFTGEVLRLEEETQELVKAGQKSIEKQVELINKIMILNSEKQEYVSQIMILNLEKQELINKTMTSVVEKQQVAEEKEKLAEEKEKLAEEKEKLAEEKEKLAEEIQQLVREKKEAEARMAGLVESCKFCSAELEQNKFEGTKGRELEELHSQVSKMQDVIQDLGKKLESVTPLVKYFLESDFSLTSPCPQLKRLVDRVQVEGLWGPFEDVQTLDDEKVAIELELETLEHERIILKEKETIIHQRLQEIVEERVWSNAEIRELSVSYNAHLDSAVRTRRELQMAQHRLNVPDYEFVDSWGGSTSSSLADISARLEEMEVLTESSHLALVHLKKGGDCMKKEVLELEEGMQRTLEGLAKSQEQTLDAQARLAAIVARRDVARRNQDTTLLLGHCSNREDNGTQDLEQQVSKLKLSLKMAADEYRRIFVEKQKLERRLNKFLAKVEIKRSSGSASSSGSIDNSVTTSASNSGVTDNGAPQLGVWCPICFVISDSYEVFTEHYNDHMS